jgi:hypothetical protein
VLLISLLNRLAALLQVCRREVPTCDMREPLILRLLQIRKTYKALLVSDVQDSGQHNGIAFFGRPSTYRSMSYVTIRIFSFTVYLKTPSLLETTQRRMAG